MVARRDEVDLGNLMPNLLLKLQIYREVGSLSIISGP